VTNRGHTYFISLFRSISDNEAYGIPEKGLVSVCWLAGAHQFNVTVLPSLTQFREIGSIFPGFLIMIATGL
jgi:hypothetical protein